MKHKTVGRTPLSLYHAGAILAVFLMGLFLFSLATVDTVRAEGLSGYLDYKYNLLTTETKNADGTSTNMRSQAFNQQYNLTFLKTLYPTMRFYANGIFEHDYLKTRTDGVDTTFKTTIMRPVVDLTWKTPVLYGGLNYSRRQETDETTGSITSTSTLVREEYNALLGWKPAGLPSLEGRYTRTNTFDKEHLVRDTVEDFAQLTSIYEPFKNLFLRYRGSYRDTNDYLNSIEIRQLTNNGRADYNGSFFSNRVTVFGSYDYTRSDIDTITNGTGNVLFQVFPLQGLFIQDFTPTLDTLLSTPFLIDTDRTGTGGNLIDIGWAASAIPPVPRRDMGLDFGSVVEVNTLYVYVDRSLLPATAGLFAWTVYTSSDNLNWTSPTTVVASPFSQLGLNRFELQLATSVTARFVKVVTLPLVANPGQPGVDHIYVTELEAYLSKPASAVTNSLTNTTGVLNLDMRTRILNTPYLFYDLSYFEVRSTGIQNTLRSVLSNALSVAHTFNPVFSGTARGAREDGQDTRGTVSAYVYNASLRATPLNTLIHNLTYSGRVESNPDGRNKRNSVFLYNTADLYKGISLLAGGGYSFSTDETGRDTATTTYNIGSTIVPHQKVTLTLNYTATDSQMSGGNQGIADVALTSQRGDFTLAVRPVQTVYLVAMLSTVHQNGQNDTLQNYSVTWSPFPGGTLQFAFTYNEILRAADNSVDKILRPSLRWNITRTSYLDVAYLDQKTKSDLQDTTTKIFSANLRITFE